MKNFYPIAKKINQELIKQINKLPPETFFEQPYLYDEMMRGEVNIKPYLDKLEKPKSEISKPEIEKLQINNQKQK
jgi:hypothetical protein